MTATSLSSSGALEPAHTSIRRTRLACRQNSPAEPRPRYDPCGCSGLGAGEAEQADKTDKTDKTDELMAAMARLMRRG
jgi:hypothetical protein